MTTPRPIPALIARLAAAPRPQPVISGQVLRYDGLHLETTGFPAEPGALAHVAGAQGQSTLAEVVGYNDGRNKLVVTEPGTPVLAGARVHLLPGGQEVGVGEGLLGRVIDAQGVPLDARPAPLVTETWPLAGKPLNPLLRTPVNKPFDCGVRIVNAALTLGEGQRMGIIAGSGVGKSVLIEMMARNAEADVVVLALIGERAREVGHMAARLMQGEAAARCCMVAVPADRSPLLRLRGVRRALAIAEWFRHRGQRVLLIIDSLTRVGHAQREIGLAMGEQPTAKGYPPSVIALIPALLERAGPGLPGEGTITAICTVLADGDDTVADPVVDSARAILDGHLVLSRAQAQMGIYPAIDVTHSISRVMPDVTDRAQQAAAMRLKHLVAAYQSNRDLVMMGGYAPGQDKELDMAIQLWPDIRALISQDPGQPVGLEASRAALLQLCGPEPDLTEQP
jgi:flagellum-specific ATP synthase